MNEKRLLYYRSAQLQLSDCEDWLGRAAAQESGSWLVAGSRVAADELLRRISERRGGIAGCSRFSLLHLASELAATELARLGWRPLTGLSESAIVRRVIHHCSREGGLVYFQPVASMPGFARALANTLAELQMDRVQEDRLSCLGPAGQDLALLLRSYRLELKDSGLADRSEILARGEEVLASRPERLPVLLLDCRPRGQAEVGFLKSLVSWSSSCLATVQQGDELTLKAYRQILPGREEEATPETSGGATRLELLRRRLFESEEHEGDSKPDDTVQFFSAAEESRECVEIVRQIRDGVAEGVCFDDVAILLRQPYLYLPLIEDAFRRARIPVYMTRGTRRPHPSGRAFLALLQCAAENLSASRFAEYLALGQVPLPDAMGAPQVAVQEWVAPSNEQLVFKTVVTEAPPADELEPLPEDSDAESPVVAGSLRTPRHWEQLLVDASVIGGKERWETRLRGLQRELELQVRRLDPDEELQRSRLLRKIHNLRHLRRFALPITGQLEALREPAKWSLWLVRLERLAGMALRRPESVLAVLSELRPMAEVGPIGLDEVEAILSERLKFLHQDPPGDRYGKVFVGGLNEVAGMAFRRVFLPGLAEGIFPQKSREDPLLLDHERTRVDFPRSLDTANHNERLFLRTAVAVAAERLVISYPRMELAQGRPRVPSFYFLDVLRAAEGRLPHVQELERRAEAASRSRLGWPAPPRAEAALDDPEYDLARLDAALHGEGGPRKGEARFLLEVNPALARSLRSRWWRWAKRFSRVDGLVNPDADELELVRKESLYQRSYSPTALQNFATCPYKFFLYAVHRLQPREERVAIEQMDPLTRGALFHEVQFRLFNQLQEEGELPIHSANRPLVEARAEALLDQVADHYFQELAPAIPSIWQAEIRGLAADLRGWIRRVADLPGQWIPHRFELAFGLADDADRDRHSQAQPVKVFDGVLLRGSIDLLERDAEGKSFRVTDHKTGRSPRESHLVVHGGEILQPLLYAAAAEELTGSPVIEGRLFYCTQRGDFEVRSVNNDDFNQEKVRQVLGVIEDWIQRGFLPAAPRPDGCRFCDYRTVCGPYEELRITRKYPEQLSDLQKIRGLP